MVTIRLFAPPLAVPSIITLDNLPIHALLSFYVISITIYFTLCKWEHSFALIG
jgi:hypothetical protein